MDDTLGLWREVCAEWVQPFFGDIMKVGDLVRVEFDGHSTIGVVVDPCYYTHPESTCYKIKAYAWGEVCIFDSYSVVRI